MFFPKLVYRTKNTPFFPILHIFAPLNDIRAYSAWSWKTALITWIFGRAWYPPWHSSAPPPGRPQLPGAMIAACCLTINKHFLEFGSLHSHFVSPRFKVNNTSEATLPSLHTSVDTVHSFSLKQTQKTVWDPVQQPTWGKHAIIKKYFLPILF